MTRTRTLVIIGCFMLALAIIVALELRSGDPAASEGQMITGALSRTPNAESTAGNDPFPSQTPPAAQEVTPAADSRTAPAGLIPLDEGTLRASNATTDLRAPGPAATGSVTAPATSGSTNAPATSGPLATGPTSAPAASGGTTHVAPSSPATPIPANAMTAAPAVKPEPARVEPAPRAATPPRQGAASVAEEAPAAPEKTKPSPAAPVAEAPKTPAPKAEAEKAAPPASASLRRTISTAAPGKLAQGEKAIIWTTLEAGPETVVFRFTGAGPLQGKGYRLNDPERYVVDLDGGWGFELPNMPTNPLVRGLRAGKQENNTRLVFDLSKPLGKCRLVKINPETLEVRIR